LGASLRLATDYREYTVGRLPQPYVAAYGRVESDSALGKLVLKIYHVTEMEPLTEAPAMIPAVGELVGVIEFTTYTGNTPQELEQAACSVLRRVHPYRSLIRFFGFMFGPNQDSIAGCVLYSAEEKLDYRSLSMCELRIAAPI